MSYDNETRLVNAAWKGDGSLWKELVKKKITPDMFFDKDAAEVYAFALEQQEKHGAFPSEVFIKQNFPVFPKIKITDPVGMLADAFKEWRQDQLIKQVITEASEQYATGDATTAMDSLQGGLERLISESVTDDGDVDLTKDTLERLKAYEEFAQRPEGLLGRPTGFPTIDDTLSGLQPGQLITVVAEPKVGKSTLALQMGIAAHDDGAPVMFQTIEMSASEMTGRYECQRAGISYSRFRTGTLKNSEMKRFRNMLKATQKMQNSFVVTEKVINIPQIKAKIEEYKPEIVIVDGVYLLESHKDFPPGSPQALTYLSRSFKKLAQLTGTTVIITTQALHHKLQGGKLSAHSIGYSSSFLQDADLVLGLEKNEDEDEDARTLSILASRNSGTADVELDWDWDQGIFAEVGAGGND